MATVLLVEDDYMYVNWLKDELESNLGHQVEVISTEQDFRTRGASIAKTPPDVVLMDIMLRWADPSNEMIPPPPCHGTFHRAGLRCLQMLRNDPRTRDVPVILYSVLDESDIARDMQELGLTARHVEKSIHPEILFAQIQRELALARLGGKKIAE